MSTQQDIYAAGFESLPPMLNKENYVPWSSRLLRYAKSRPNGKLIHNSIINVQTDDELTENELKQIEADDQAIQTILLGLLEDIYAANVGNLNGYNAVQNVKNQVAQNPRVQNIGNQNGLIGALGNANQNLNRIGNLVVARAEGNVARHNGYQIRCYNCRGVGHFARNCTVRPRRRDVAYLQTQLLIAQKEEARIQLQAKEFDLMAAAADLDEIEEVNANCILMANLQQASTSGTQTDKAPVYDSDESAEFMGTVRFRNDHVARILGFGDLQWGNILIIRVYFLEGLGHNLFSVGQFCDSDLEVAFRRNACFVRNLKGVDLLKEDRSTNIYTINLHEMASASPICLPKFKYHKEHLCPSCEQGKSKRASHPPKPVPNSKQRLHLLHMNLCGPMRITSINGKQYVLVIVDDYSRYTWVHFLRSKDEAPEVIKTFLKRITVLLQNRMLVEAARTMLIFSRAPLFLWAEAIATACFTQNRSIIHRRFNKTPYELINGRKPDISFLHVFGALYYPKNDREDIGKLGAKGDISFFIGYSADSCAYRVFNRRTKKIMETMNVSFDELSAMNFEQRSSKLELQSMTSRQISSGLELNYALSTITTQQPTEGKLDLLSEAMYDDFISGQPSTAQRIVLAIQAQQVRQTSMTSTSIADSAPTPTNSSSHATNFTITSQDVDELNSQQQHAHHQGNQAHL
nr:hypothetical protein [Tanacetum cinerariifolium]